MSLSDDIISGRFQYGQDVNPVKKRKQTLSEQIISGTYQYEEPTIEPTKPSIADNLMQFQDNFTRQSNILDVAEQEYQKALGEAYRRNNVNYDTRNLFQPREQFSRESKYVAEKPMLDNKPEDIKRALQEVEPQRQKANEELNKYLYAKYQKDQAEVENEDTTFYDKTLGNVVRGGQDLFSIFNTDKYRTEDGREITLPSRNELKQQKVSQDYDTTLGRIGGDVAYNVSKIATADLLNKATGGVGGSAIYWADMFGDNYKNAVNQGYDKENALAYSAVGTGAEFLTGKFLGSATKGLTGGKTSELSKAISNVANKLVKNKTVSNIIGNMGSEAAEEFVQEYIDNLNEIVTLEQSTNPKDYAKVFTSGENLENALYSAAVGALSGGLTNIGGSIQEARTPQISPIEEQNNLNNTITPQVQETSPGSLKTSALDYNIDTENGTINSVDKMMSDRGIKASFNADLFDNTNPTENEDIRYSKGTTYQDFVNKNFKSNGTGNKLKDIRKPKEQKKTMALVDAKPVAPKEKAAIVEAAKPVKETPKRVEAKKETKPVEVKPLLTKEEQQELNTLENIPFDLSTKEEQRLQYLKDKQAGVKIKHESLIEKQTYDTVKNEYRKYKNKMETFDNTALNKSKETISGNKQGRRTKEQWLDVAEHLGSNIKDMDSKDLEKYAIQSFIEARPNQKENLNRQGQKYVEFKLDDWLASVYKGAGVGEKYSIETTTRDMPKETKELTPKTTSEEIFESVKPGTKESKFYENITERAKFITKENRDKISKEEEVQFYTPISNKESMDKAKARLDEGGIEEVSRWLTRDEKGASDSIDVAEGWILLKRAQDSGDYDLMVNIAKKMRTMGTKSGQAIQMYNLMSRLTPEGMVKYAASELDEAFEKASENKSKKWLEKNVSNFELTPEETKFIVDTMKKVETMEDGRPKQVELAKIQKMLQDKLPPEKGSALKSWFRISMLFNPKTQVRNVLGNAVIMPVNTLADATASLIDKQIAKKTGIRTTGTTKIKNLAKGGKKGLYNSYEDFKLGINTRDMKGNKFEVGEGKAFNEKHEGLLAKPRNAISKALNKVDNILNFTMDVGDRVFYEGIFLNSINNQLELNNTKEVTQDMIDIATQEALAKTWNDNNEYTKFVLNTRRAMNKLHFKGYGLGDVLIPFAKTPANLTKAIVDYSPVGLVKTLTSDAVKLRNNIATGKVTAQQQHEFVQNLGKAVAGSMLYIVGYSLAKAGVTSGANDDDKDVSDFMRNTLGIQPYSVKIGNRSFTYDWAQPVAAPFAITADAVKNKDKNNTILDAITSVLDTGFNILLEQSFLSGIKDVLNSYGSKVEGIENQVLGLPARAVPTLLKQINDMIDPNVRMVYEKNQQLESAKNQVKAKTPGLSKELPVRRDTLGREVKKFGGDNNVFNVFLNPANTSKGKPSAAGEEIYALYEATKDKTIMPRYPSSALKMTNKEQSEFLRISGGIIEDNVENIRYNYYYQQLTDDEKAKAVKNIVDYAYNKAKAEVNSEDMSRTYNRVNKAIEDGIPLYDYYAEKVYNNR